MPPESRAKAGRPTGGRAYGYRDGKIDRGEALLVLEIFGESADGIWPRSITARERRKPTGDRSRLGSRASRALHSKPG